MTTRGSSASNGGNSSGGSNAAIVLNVEQFIQDVECRPAIWNRNYHCNKQFLELTWIELSKLYKLPCQTLKAKWKGLRDNFRVEYKRIPRDDSGEMLINPEFHESKWAHYRPLLFLVDHMRHRTIKDNATNLSNILIDNDNFNGASGENEECVVEPDLAHGLVHNDYTSDGQDDDETNELKNSVIAIAPPVRTWTKRSQNSRKRRKQHSDSSLVLDIKTEPTDTVDVTPPSSTRKVTFNTSNLTTINGQQQQQQQPQQQPVSKIKLRKMQTSSNSTTDDQQCNNGGLGILENHQHSKTSNLIINNDEISIESVNCFNGNGQSQQQQQSNGLLTDKPKTIMAATSSSPIVGGRQNNLDRDDDDYHYLMSLHPYMNKLQPSQKLRVRTKIQKLILKELYKEDLD